MRLGPFAICAAAILSVLLAQELVADPADLPPDGFVAAEYIDRNGCSFFRVSLAGQDVWAERKDLNDVPVCGLTPSLASMLPSDDLPVIPPNRRGAAPQFPVAGQYLQVGAFGRTSTADRVAVTLQSLGMSALRQDFRRGSGRLRVLFAGPFPDDAAAQAARREVRRYGFSDAFVWTQD